MSRFATFLIIITSVISYSFAYSAMPQQDESFQNNSSSKVKESIPTTGMAPRMSSVVDKLLINANSLQLTEKQKKSWQTKKRERRIFWSSFVCFVTNKNLRYSERNSHSLGIREWVCCVLVIQFSLFFCCFVCFYFNYSYGIWLTEIFVLSIKPISLNLGDLLRAV